MTHFLTPYYRPSWQGGDTAQPLCRKPLFGWCGDDSEPMTPSREDVTCDLCRIILDQVPASVPSLKLVHKPSRSEEFEAPPRRKNDDLKHCRAVWEASRGFMFPFGLSRHVQRGAA